MAVLGGYDLWLEATRELLEHDAAYFPRAPVTDLLDQTMDASVVSWNWAEEDGSFGCEFNRPGPCSEWLLTNVFDQVGYEMQQRHPLLRWFRKTGDPRPMSVGRVPRSAVSPADFAALVEVLGPAGLEQQISIPYRLGPRCHRAFVLARPDIDFCDDDMELARRIQPLLALIERQVSVTLNRRTRLAAEAGLTGREVAVLVLLADGGTAEAIARRLGISPRTVHNHLRHIYRKLGVDDRMRAVLAAQAMGLIRRGPARTVGWDDQELGPPATGVPAEAIRPSGDDSLSWAYVARPEADGGPMFLGGMARRRSGAQARPPASRSATSNTLSRGTAITQGAGALNGPVTV